MATLKKRVSFFESVEGAEIQETLVLMTKDTAFNTGSSYSINTERYPDNQIPFVDKHMNYLNSHPAINPNHYIANLRLITRLR